MKKLPQLNKDNLRNASRAAINEMVAAFLDEVEEGNIDPVETFVFSHKLLEFAALLHSQMKDHIKGVTGEFYGLKISEVKTNSTYDYGVCNSIRLNFLVEELNKMKERIEKEQAFLKALPGVMQVVDESTGECYEIRPPVNRFSISPKIEWI